YVDHQILLLEHIPIRGYQSSMDYRLTIGLGNNARIDSLVVTWPDNRYQVFRDVPADQLMTVKYEDGKTATQVKAERHAFRPYFTSVSADSVMHIENDFNEFDRDRLLYHMQSTQGPAFAVADLNNDGRDDIFVGGSVGNPGKIYLQQSDYRFVALPDFVNDDTSADE